MAPETAAEPRTANVSTLVAYEWMCDPNHTPEARTVYAILAAHAGPNRVTGPRTPDRTDLSRILDVPAYDVDHVLAEMFAAQWITPMWLPIYRRGVKKVKQIYRLNDAHLLAASPAAADAVTAEPEILMSRGELNTDRPSLLALGLLAAFRVNDEHSMESLTVLYSDAPESLQQGLDELLAAGSIERVDHDGDAVYFLAAGRSL